MGKSLSLPTQARLLELFEDGGDTLIRRVPKGKAQAGTRCTGQTSSGYYRVRVDGVYYLVHRLLWVLRYGELSPELDVDHRNGQTLDNSIANLRLATHSQNMQNSRRGANNTSGAKGVSWHAGCRKWLVQLSINKQYKYGGVYTNYAEACAVANRLRAEHHSAYARR